MSIEEVTKQFIRPDSEIAALRKARQRKSTTFPTMDGYY